MQPTAVATICVLGVVALASAEQQPTFRSSVDLIVVDVQVVGNDGLPVTSLAAGEFDVTIGGKRRQVLSAELIRTGDRTRSGATGERAAGGATATNIWPATGPGRLFILAIDRTTLQADAWQRVSSMTSVFVSQLDPHDRVGLFAYPSGPNVLPTLERASISRTLSSIVGTGQVLKTSFNLSTSEIIDIAAEAARSTSPGTAVRRTRAGVLDPGSDTPTVQRVQDRECPNDANCAARILMDAGQAANMLEARVQQSVDGLSMLLAQLREIPGRKTVVLLSGGMAVSDVPGGRPQIDDLAASLGRELAQANAAIYTLQLDAGRRSAFSAANQRVTVASVDALREASLMGRWLERFSDASGGALLRVETDDGAAALDRILRETSAYYLLGVEPAPSDRDGTLRALGVKVRARGTTVRHRNWVIVPKKTTSDVIAR
jgi:VWFA-related protein